MTKWKNISYDLQFMITKEAYNLYVNSDYEVFQNINNGLYRITIHKNPEEKKNIVSDHLYESDVYDFFQSAYEDYMITKEAYNLYVNSDSDVYDFFQSTYEDY